MYRDPIVEEIRKHRQEYAAQFNYDIDAICEDIRREQQRSGRNVVVREPRPAVIDALNHGEFFSEDASS